MAGISKRIRGSWVSSNYGVMKTATDTITTLPADIYANDTTATVGLKGQTVQSSTPSPTSPVMPQGCGERTGNLFDGNYTIAVMSVSGHTATLNTASSGRTAIVKCEPNTTYTLKKYSVSNRFIIAESDIKPVNGTAMSIIQNDSSISEYTFTTSNTTQYVAIYCSTSSEQSEPQLMLNTGSTPLPYEPYGYKLTISSANTTTLVYLGEVETTRKVKKVVLDGTEVFYASGNWGKTDTAVYYTALPNVLNLGTNVAYVMCSHYVGKSRNYIYDNDIECSGMTGANSLTFRVSRQYAGTKEDFLAYLAAQYAAGTPVTVWYVLAEPETGIVNEPLMKIGDYADEVSGISIPVTAGANTLSVDATVQPSEVTVNYKGWHSAIVHERTNGAWT